LGLTSRRHREGVPGNDPESQLLELRAAGVKDRYVYRDVGVSGSTGATSRGGWHALRDRLEQGDTLVVVSIDRIGRRRLDVMGVIRDLREMGVKIRSLNQSEATWARYLDADPHTPEAFLADILASFAAWNAEQELESIRRRTVAGMARARAQGKLPGPPNKLRDDQVAIALERRRQGWSLKRTGASLDVSRTTVSRYLEQAQAGDCLTGAPA
jgi:putative DNA-invertase from lambdoid prophage Rac